MEIKIILVIFPAILMLAFGFIVSSMIIKGSSMPWRMFGTGLGLVLYLIALTLLETMRNPYVWIPCCCYILGLVIGDIAWHQGHKAAQKLLQEIEEISNG